MLRYEDLSLDPHGESKKLFDFLGLHFHIQVKQFLDSHIKVDAGGVSSTYRNSKNAAFHWRFDLKYSEVLHIEDNCDQALKYWGYLKSVDESKLRENIPLSNYSINFF